jgi:hypothetical protein
VRRAVQTRTEVRPRWSQPLNEWRTCLAFLSSLKKYSSTLTQTSSHARIPHAATPSRDSTNRSRSPQSNLRVADHSLVRTPKGGLRFSTSMTCCLLSEGTQGREKMGFVPLTKAGGSPHRAEWRRPRNNCQTKKAPIFMTSSSEKSISGIR